MIPHWPSASIIILTITNGSVIAQVIPAGFIVQNVATDRAVYVAAGSANGYGYATVPAHALISGENGDIAPLVINQVIGSSVYIRNLTAFKGGSDAYTVTFATAQDRQTALGQVRGLLAHESAGLHYPCSEVEQVSTVVIVIWRCQFITYHIPAFYHVTDVRVIGKNLLLTVWFVARPVHIWKK